MGALARVFSSDLRIRVLATGLSTYPDVTVVCGPLERDPESENASTNPTLIVEVPSDSTEDYDRGEKFEHYRRLSLLREYVLVSHRARLIELWRQDADGSWSQQTASAGESATVPSLQCELLVDEICQDILL